MSLFRRFLGQTAIYGGGYFAIRILNYLIVSIYLVKKLDSPFHFGAYREFFFLIGFFVLFLGMRMETTFFRFAQDRTQKNQAFTTAFVTLLSAAGGFWLLCILLRTPLAYSSFINYPQYTDLVVLSATIVLLDVLIAMPFASLRVEERPLWFSLNKIIHIGLFIVWIVGILEIWPRLDDSFAERLSNDRILYLVFWGYIFASGTMLLMFMPRIVRSWVAVKADYLYQMLIYGLPLIAVMMGGYVINNGYTLLMKFLLSGDVMENVERQGLFSVIFQVAMIMSIFTTAYNYAAEPFFFQQSRLKKPNHIYRYMAYGYAIAALIVMLTVMMAADFLFYFDIYSSEYRANLYLLPFLLLGMFLQGLYYNFSVWYKVQDHTNYGAIMACLGMVTYLVSAYFLILHFQEPGAIMATIIAYIVMLILNHIFGHKLYPVNYDYRKIAFLTFLTYGLFYVHNYLLNLWENDSIWILIGTKSLMIIVFVSILIRSERKLLRTLVPR